MLTMLADIHDATLGNEEALREAAVAAPYAEPDDVPAPVRVEVDLPKGKGSLVVPGLKDG